MKRKSFESLTPIFPNEKISVGKSGKIAMRMIDLLAPIGKGQRGIIVSPPHSLGPQRRQSSEYESGHALSGGNVKIGRAHV